jgi:hypothetical protein
MRPIDDSLRRPITILLMIFRAMLTDGSWFKVRQTARMAGDSLSSAKDFDSGGSSSYLNDLASELVWDAVEMIVVSNVIVDVNRSLFELSKLVWH